MVREIEKAAIQKVRSFNRTVAERIGALNDQFLQRSRPMNEARLLWEIGHDGAEVRELRSRLGIDSGYLSRVLRSLETQGLVMTRANREDRRVRRASLTRAGLHERKELDRRSDALASSILQALSARQRDRLMTAMGEVERLLQASMVRFAIEDPTSADARWCFNQYFAELSRRFEEGFDPGLSISAGPQETNSSHGAVASRTPSRPAYWLRSTQVSSTKACGIEKNVDRSGCARSRCSPPAARRA
jgi:DNA-binding MarR family transcriptional regulator